MAISLSIAHGTPLGGQHVTITGTGFGSVEGAVTIEGRVCDVTSWADTLIDIVTPARRTDGLLVVGSDDVAVVVTPDAGPAQSGTYHYNSTRWDLVLQSIREYVAQISVDRGDYYTIGSAQVEGIRREQYDTGEAWPQVIVYGMPIDYTDPDSPNGFDTGRMKCVAQAIIPLGDVKDWDPELRFLCADLYRAIRLRRRDDKIAKDIVVTSVYPGRVEGEQSGSKGVATVEFTVTLKHVNTNMNSATQGE